MSIESRLKSELQQLLKQRENLEEEIKKIKAEPIRPTKVYDMIEDRRKNSDTGLMENWGKKWGERELPSWEVKERRDNRIRYIEEEIKTISRKIGVISKDLEIIEWNKPENIAKREEEKQQADKELQKKQIEEERKNFVKRHEALYKLVEYLRIAGFKDLADDLAKMRFAFSNRTYINKEIELQKKEKDLKTNGKTTTREYREIKKNVRKLSKEATIMAKKYKNLYTLYSAARKIVLDIEEKGILMHEGETLKNELRSYFRTSSSLYSYSSSKTNLGYKYLKFYRDLDSKYNKNKRKK